MFFPGGLAGVLMMHVPAWRLGKLGSLVVPYIKTVIPAMIGILGLAALMELVFHARHAAAGEDEITLFWTTFDGFSVLPWALASIACVGGIWIARATAPGLRAAWHRANTPDRRPAA